MWDVTSGSQRQFSITSENLMTLFWVALTSGNFKAVYTVRLHKYTNVALTFSVLAKVRSTLKHVMNPTVIILKAYFILVENRDKL